MTEEVQPEVRPTVELPTLKTTRRSRRPSRLLWRRAAAFVIAGGIVIALALDDGGYDIVSRQRFGIVLWVAIALGFAFGVLPRGRPSRLAWLALAATGAFAALNLVALGWTESQEQTFAEVARVVQYVGLLTLAYAALNRDTWRAALAGLAAAALVVPLLALVARLAPDLITDHTIGDLGTDRLSYPFGYWNAVGAWGAMAIAIGLLWSSHAKQLWARILVLAAVPPAALTVYLSYSRGGAIAAAIAVVAAVALARNRWTTAAHALAAGAGAGLAVLAVRDHEQIARATGDDGAAAVLLVLVLAAIACATIAATTSLTGVDGVRMSPKNSRSVVGVSLIVLAVIALAARNDLSDVWNDFRDQRVVTISEDSGRVTSSTGTRRQVWSTGQSAFHSDPWRGIGPGSFEFYWSREGNDPQFVRDAHSLYVEQLAELGVLGLALIAAVMSSLLLAALAARSRLTRDADLGASAAAIAAFIVYLFSAGVDWMWELPGVTALALGGIAVAGAAGSRRWGPHPMRVGPQATLIALALAAALVQVPGLVSTQRLRASAAELGDGNSERAAELADEAVQAESWAAEPYVQRGIVEWRRGDITAARADLLHAIDEETTNWRWHLVLARIEADAGNRAGAQAEITEARRLAPNSPLLLPTSPIQQEIDNALSGSTRPR